MNKYVLDRESAKKYLTHRQKGEMIRGLYLVMFAFLYIYFYEHEVFEEYQRLVLWLMPASYAFWVGVEWLISWLRLKELTDCSYYLKDNVIVQEFKKGDKVFLGLKELNFKSSDIAEARFISEVRKLTIPHTLPGREQLISEIREAILLSNTEIPEGKNKTSLAKLGRYAVHTFLFLVLTVLTQVGGLIYLFTLYITRKFSLSGLKPRAVFAAIYLFFTLLIIPLIAPLFGRSPLPVRGTLRPLNYLTVLLNRHYVRTDLKDQLTEAANAISMRFENTSVKYLDANFPFTNGFPLLPHLSHDDGRKVDLAFFYQEQQTGEATETVPSVIGYGIYEAPAKDEVNYPYQCKNEGHSLYGVMSTLVPQWRAKDYTVDEERTVALLKILLDQEHTSKVFIEPHLKQRWGLQDYEKIRFQGCHAVRHDDHIHLQVK